MGRMRARLLTLLPFLAVTGLAVLADARAEQLWDPKASSWTFLLESKNPSGPWVPFAEDRLQRAEQVCDPGGRGAPSVITACA